MTMILFGVVKKNAATVVTRARSSSKSASPLPPTCVITKRISCRRFPIPDLAARRKGLQEMTVKRVNSLSDKMKGFSRKETHRLLPEHHGARPGSRSKPLALRMSRARCTRSPLNGPCSTRITTTAPAVSSPADLRPDVVGSL